MSNFNKIILMGRLTRDPELRYTPQGTAVTDIGMAINREFSVGEERRKEVVFVDVTFWARQAEVLCQYLRKGAPLFLEGRLQMDSWQGQDGQKRSRLKVVGENFQFISGPRGEGGSREPDGEPGRVQENNYGSDYRTHDQERAPLASGHEGNGEDRALGIDDSEIPF